MTINQIEENSKAILKPGFFSLVKMNIQRKTSVDRRGVKSLFIKPIPKIILDGSENSNGSIIQMPHSRSAGELAMCLDCPSDYGLSRHFQSSSGLSMESRNQIDIYCSPRMHRKTFNANNGYHDDDCSWLETLDPSYSQNGLGLGGHCGSALSLTSEYTSRSIGLISNDSSSDSTQFTDKIEQIKHRQSLLRRYLSNPEKPLEDQDSPVQRSTKSVNNLHNKTEHFEDSTISDESMADILPTSGSNDIPYNNSDFKRNMFESDPDTNAHLVTMITDEIHVKEGRIRQWLTSIENNK